MIYSFRKVSNVFFLFLFAVKSQTVFNLKVCMMGGGYRVRVGGEWGWEGSGRLLVSWDL